MKFIDDPELEQLNSLLCFDTPDCKVVGGIDLYTTKPVGSDKKLLKALDKQLYSQQQDALSHYDKFPLSTSMSPPTVSVFSPPSYDLGISKSYHPTTWRSRRNSRLSSSSSAIVAGGLGASLQASTLTSTMPPVAGHINIAGSMSQLSPSPFGPLDQAASRKTFANLISVLNASDPDHDFSSLQPEDFTREDSSTQVLNSFNNTLLGLGQAVPPRLWECLDKNIDLKECTIYSHTPPQSILADEPGIMWSMSWFFFNKRRKRVAYLHLRANRHYQSPILSAVDGRRRRFDGRGGFDDDDDYDLTYSSDSQMYDEVVGDLELE